MAVKKLNDKQKVVLLENAILSGKTDYVKEVLDNYAPFEFTARALGLASLYGNKEIVKNLIEKGASFEYKLNESLKRKYNCYYSSKTSQYAAEYSPMVSYTGMDVEIPVLASFSKFWHFGRCSETFPEIPSGEERADIAEILFENKDIIKFNDSIALYYALIWGCRPVAERMLALGVELNEALIDVLSGNTADYDRIDWSDVYWKNAGILRSEFFSTMKALKEDDCVYALEQLSSLMNRKKQVIKISQKAYDGYGAFYRKDVIKTVFKYTDTSMINKTKLLEELVERNDTAALQEAVKIGLIDKPAKRDKLIDKARDRNKLDVLAWLLDYKAKNADFQKEAEQREKKEKAELLSKPNKAAELKKIWSFIKQDDGTLELTDYKGELTEIEVPSNIGNKKVTSIGKWCFAPDKTRIKNEGIRRKITKIVIQDGIEYIKERAFLNCEQLIELKLPETLKYIGEYGICGCKSLEKLDIPESVVEIEESAFSSCQKIKEISIPEKVNKFGVSVFNNCYSLKEVVVPEGTVKIDTPMFNYCLNLTEIRLPDTVRWISNKAFATCKALQKIDIPDNAIIYDSSSKAGYYVGMDGFYDPDNIQLEEAELVLPNKEVTVNIRKIG